MHIWFDNFDILPAIIAAAGSLVLLILTVLLTRRRKPTAPSVQPAAWPAPAPMPPASQTPPWSAPAPAAPPAAWPAPWSPPTPQQPTQAYAVPSEPVTQVAGQVVQPTWQLTGLSGSTAGQTAALLQRLTIGRSIDNDLHPDDAKISRHHALLEQTPAGFQVSDLGSTNGTFVNGQRIGYPTLLREGDVLAVGDCQWQVQQLSAQAASPLPPAPSAQPITSPTPLRTAPPAAPAAAVCSRCGAPLAEGSAFCVRCGTPVQAPAAPKTCARCGSPVTPGTSYCIVCGAPIGG